MQIRSATVEDRNAIWSILEPIVRGGEVFATPCDMTREAALNFWMPPSHEVFVAEEEDSQESGRAMIIGTYFLRPNQMAGGGHVANAGYATAAHATGRGVARAMCAHSIEFARSSGYRAMQFNFVVSTNAAAVHLWESMGFGIVGRLPAAFHHPVYGFVDVFVMYRAL